MGAALASKSSRTILRNLNSRMKRIREKVDGIEVVAGFVRGKSSSDSIFKAYVSEFGSMTTGAISSDKGASIPSRPFMYQSVPQIKKNLASLFTGSTTRNLEGKMNTAGDVMILAIESSLSSGDFVPNAPYTIEKKGSSQPLVDTGEMRDNITSEVRRAK